MFANSSQNEASNIWVVGVDLGLNALIDFLQALEANSIILLGAIDFDDSNMALLFEGYELVLWHPEFKLINIISMT